MGTTYSSSIEDLMVAGRDGDEGAWEQLVSRYQPLINSVVRRYRLSAEDAHDVSQHVWMHLVDLRCTLRTARALPGWISTTATHKCFELQRANRRALSVDPTTFGAFGTGEGKPVWRGADGTPPVDDALLRDERCGLLRDALAELKDDHRELLLMLVSDPPLSYSEVSRRTGLPVGSIGPTRARLLKKLRSSLAVRSLADDGDADFLLAA